MIKETRKSRISCKKKKKKKKNRKITISFSYEGEMSRRKDGPKDTQEETILTGQQGGNIQQGEYMKG